jgi:kinesin family protein 20
MDTFLLVLGRCLMAIRNNQMKKSENLVPFRDSKPTRLFQTALTGRETLVIIVNVNPSPFLHQETLNVLTFPALAIQDISKVSVVLLKVCN